MAGLDRSLFKTFSVMIYISKVALSHLAQLTSFGLIVFGVVIGAAGWDMNTIPL